MHDYNTVPAVRIFAANDSEFAEKDKKHRKNNVSFAFSANSNVAVTVSFLFTTI